MNYIRLYRQELALWLARMAIRAWPMRYSCDVMFKVTVQEAIDAAELVPGADG